MAHQEVMGGPGTGGADYIASHPADDQAGGAGWSPSPKLKILERWVSYALATLLTLNIGLVFVAALLRYFLGFGLPWSLEVSKLLLSGVVFLGSAVAFHHGEHRSLRIILDMLPKPVAATIDAFHVWIVAGFSVVFGLSGIAWFNASHDTILGSNLPTQLMTVPPLLGVALMLIMCVAILSEMRRKAMMIGLIAAAVFGGLVALSMQYYSGLIALPAAFALYGAVLLVLIFLGMPVGFSFAVICTILVATTDGAIAWAGLARRLGDMEFVLVAVPFFIAAGLLMEAGDITERIIRVARAFVGHFRGGMGQVTIGSMYFMSGVTGSEAADVAAVGTVMRKPMARAGFSGGESTGILVAASVMGASVPPSIGLIVLAAATGVSVGALFLGGVVPAAVLAVVLSIAVYIRARIKGVSGEPKLSGKERLKRIKGAAFAIGLPVIIIGGLTSGLATPTEVSAVSVVYVLLVEFLVHRKLRVRQLLGIAVDTSVLTGMLLFIVAAASSLVYVSTFALIPQRVGKMLVTAAGSVPVVFLLITILALILLGMLMEGLPALMILPPLLMPTALSLGIDPLHYAMVMFFAVYIGANIPPIGAGYYLAASVMRIRIKDGMLPSIAYLGIVALGVVILALLPELTLAVPRWLGLH